MPIGFWLMSLGRPDVISCSAYSAESTEAKFIARFCTKAASTLLRVKTTVIGSVVSIRAMFLSRLMLTK
ncbi:hypothetical protein D3C79_890780 [compost metagenome]